MEMSPLTHSRISRTKKSMFGPPIPMLTIDMGVRLYRPVMVRKPRSEESVKGGGDGSRRAAAIALARDGEPTVSCGKNFG